MYILRFYSRFSARHEKVDRIRRMSPYRRPCLRSWLKKTSRRGRRAARAKVQVWFGLRDPRSLYWCWWGPWASVCGGGRYKSRIQQQASVFGRLCGRGIRVYHRTCFGSTAYLSRYYPGAVDTTPPPPSPSDILNLETGTEPSPNARSDTSWLILIITAHGYVVVLNLIYSTNKNDSVIIVDDLFLVQVYFELRNRDHNPYYKYFIKILFPVILFIFFLYHLIFSIILDNTFLNHF